MQEKRETILFSPIGATDPIRKMYDGPCLHIIRHYKPARVVLFLTKEMGDKEKAEGLYTRPIQRLAPDTPVECIFSEIVDAHHYESFLHTIPQAVYGLHERFPEAEILMNITSGTPQMTTAVAILAAQEPWTRPIQVVTPSRGSNANGQGEEHPDLDTMLETNLDDEEGAENRCEEPPLRAFRYHELCARIEALVSRYEYGAAYTIAVGNADVPEAVKKILRHASYRSRLQSKKTKEILTTCQGVRLFPYGRRQEELVEYFLSIQLEQKTGNLMHVLVQSLPFLYELLREYVRERTDIPLEAMVEKKSARQWRIRCNLVRQKLPGLLDHMNRAFPDGFRDSDLSARILIEICRFAARPGKARDAE